MSAKKVVVITGANGLLGRRLVAMLAPSHAVWAVVHSMPNDPIPGPNYCVIDFSRDWETADLPDRPDSIIHLAQSANFRNVPERALDVFQVNIASTARLLDYAWRVGAERFVYASSGGIYAGGHQHAFRENSPIVQPDTVAACG
jgi:nucleoside-diphosphate-sugar epimerase